MPLACFCTTGIFVKNSIATIVFLLELLPLDILQMAEARKSAYRLKSSNHWRTGTARTGHATIIKVPLWRTLCWTCHLLLWKQSLSSTIRILFIFPGRQTRRLGGEKETGDSWKTLGKVHRWFINSTEMWFW